jgi:hypothetical protein
VITVDDRPLYVPNYQSDGYMIWGLSAMMLVELLAVGFGQTIGLDHPPARGRLHHLPGVRRTPTES